MASRYFGTDGIRDVANAGNLLPARILATAQALGALLRERERERGERPRAGIAMDTRLSGKMIFSALAAGLTAQGCTVIDFDVLPTPALAFLTQARSLDLGIMISASHNPMEDNGIKVFATSGHKLSDEAEARVERLMDGLDTIPAPPTGAGLGTVHADPTGYDDYVAALERRFEPGMLQGLSIAVDCANGAAWKTAPDLFARLGARVNVMANSPNGTNINAACGSVFPEALRELVLAEGCDAGVALDGDGDRSIFVAADGSLVDGDRVMTFMAEWMRGRGELAGDAVVATVMSNVGMEVALRERGIALRRTPVGDRFVTECMQAEGFSLGGEQSGHIIFGTENNYTGDGTFTALKVFQAAVETGRSLADLAACMERFPQILINVAVARKPPLAELPLVQERIARAESVLGAEGRVVVRYSGTEPKLRVMTEGRDAQVVKTLADSIVEAVRSEIG